jgi:hypothetical protein
MFKRPVILAAIALAATAIGLAPSASVPLSRAAAPPPAADPDAGLDDTPAGGLDQTDLGGPIDETPDPGTGTTPPAP